MIFMYNAYLLKMLTSFLSHPIGQDKVIELKDIAMNALGSHSVGNAYDSMDNDARDEQQAIDDPVQSFICLLEVLGEVNQRNRGLTDGNEALWNFVYFAGEDHSSYQTLVAFLDFLSRLASGKEGAKRVFELLQGNAIQNVGWNIFFNAINVYEQKLNRCLQNSSAFLPSVQEGDLRVLVAYLRVLQSVIENGNLVENLPWLPDIIPFFSLLPYKNVPPYLQGAISSTISTFVKVSPALKYLVWSLLECYDLSLAVTGNGSQGVSSQVYHMRYELTEVEAWREIYPSILSYLNLLNVLIEKENDLSDHGKRFFGIFSFVRDQAFGSFSERAYADPVEKWQLVVACLRHFQLMLGMYNISDYNAQNAMNQLPQSGHIPQSPDDLPMHIPAIELMKDFMSGKTIFQKIMRILMLGVNKVLKIRSSQLYGPSLEEAVHLSLELLLLALEMDSTFADYWRPLYQPLDVILSQDSRQIVMLLQYVGYDILPAIQQCSIKIMDIISGRRVQLVSIIMMEDAARNLIEDYASCLEAHTQEFQDSREMNKDTGFLILQLLINNLSRPAPNVTHLLLRFDVDGPVEMTILQPKYHYSCLRVILHELETLSNDDANSVLQEFGFQLIYYACVDAMTGGPMIELLYSEKYMFFMSHLDTFLCSPLPERNNNQVLRISNLQQRAWMLKLLALELHVGEMGVIAQHESCRCLITQLFLQEHLPIDRINAAFQKSEIQQHKHISHKTIYKTKVLELLSVIQFRPHETNVNFPHTVLNFKENLQVDKILGNSATIEKGGVYCYSERGDRIINLAAFQDKLWQQYHKLETRSDSVLTQERLVNLMDAIEQLLIWGSNYNKGLQENAAQLHMLIGWSQVVQLSVSSWIQTLENHSQTLFEILNVSLNATTSKDCSLEMALLLSQVVLTCMAKLQDYSFLSPVGENMDYVKCINVLSSVRLSNSACHSILLNLVTAILQSKSSEKLRICQYTIMLSYFKCCWGMLDSNVSLGMMRDLLVEGKHGEDCVTLQKIEKDLVELTQMNFSILKQEATALFDVVVRDATHGREVGKAMAFYVLEALLGIDQDQLFLNHIQRRGLLCGCLLDINNNSCQEVILSSVASTRHLYTLEAELALLLRVGYGYKKRGAQVLFAMGILECLSSCRVLDVYLTEDLKCTHALKMGFNFPSQHKLHHQIVSSVLRLVLCLTQLVDMSEYFEESNKVICEVRKFVIAHQGLFGHILGDEDSQIHVQSLEELEIAIAILSKVWPFVEKDECGIVQALFKVICLFFSEDTKSRSKYITYIRNLERAVDQSCRTNEKIRKMEFCVKHLQRNLMSYLYYLVTRKNLRLRISMPNVIDGDFVGNYTFGRQRQPTLELVASLLHQATTDLECAVEEKCLLLTKTRAVNELSRHELDEILETYGRQKYLSASDSIHKRKYLAMIEMHSAVAYRENLMTLILDIVEHALHIFYIHFENRLQVPDLSNQEMKSYFNKEENHGSNEGIMELNRRIVPILQKLEALNEDRAGHRLKLLHRLVHSLKSRILLKCINI